MPIDLDRLRTGGAFGGALGRAAHAEQAPTRELQVGERVGAFRVERELSRGGMAIVYLAERADGEFTQRVALKWMGGTRDRDATEALFRRERDILAGLEHPGIARLIDGGRSHDGMLWFAMELVEGEAIDQWCERRALGLRARVGLVVALTEALAFAHARLLIHRDIKPGNVLVGNDGRVKLLDFGIARLADQHDLIGGFAMTPGYASPEQWSGDEITIASDVYQSGLLLAVLCGALEPAAGPRHVTRLDAVATGEPLALATQRLTRLPRDLGAIVRRATAIAPGNRYATVEALGEDLQAWLDRRPVTAREGGVLYRLRCRLARHPVAATAGLLALVGMAAMGRQLVVERNAATEQAARATAEAVRARSALEFMTELLLWAAPQKHGGKSVSVDDALARGVEQLGDTLADQPRLRAELLYLFGRVYTQRQQPQQAIPLLEAALALQENIPELDPFDTAVSRTRLGNMLGSADRRRSIALFEQSIAAMTGRTDVESARLRVASRRFLAGQQYQSNELASARASIHAALEDGSAALPADDNELFYVRKEMSTILGALGDIDAVLRLRRANLEHVLRVDAEDLPTASDLRLSLAGALIVTGEYAEARSLLEQDRPVRLRLWGETSIDHAQLLYADAQLHHARGQWQQARALVDAAIRIAEGDAATGPSNLSRYLVLAGVIERDAGRLPESEALLRGALDPLLHKRSSLRDFGQFRIELARTQLQQGRTQHAAEVLDAAERDMAPLPAQHFRRGLLMLRRAELAAARDDASTARVLATQAIAHLTPAASRTPHVVRDAALAEAHALLERLRGAALAPTTQRGA
jgi:tetratricopeptide (TPR) repeat protein/tRNA A-37 threonylcarbamoyl transferase component Bud32